MKRVGLSICAFIVASQLIAQTEVDIDQDSITLAIFNLYEPKYKATMIYSDTSEAVNTTPEKLMSSIISANSQEWVNYNTKGGKKAADQKKASHFKKVKNRKKENNYFELLSKLEFSYGSREIVIVKFYLNLEENEKPIAGTTTMEYVNNSKWKIISESSLTPISMCMMIFKQNVMLNLLTNNPTHEIEKKLLKVAYGESGLNFEKLLEIDYTPSEKDYLTNPLNW